MGNQENLWFQIITKDGDSFYRSWTDKRGDKIANNRLDIASVLKSPEILTSISTGKFDLTFKAMVPIYDEEGFIGIFEVIAKFNSIADKLEKEGIDAVFLVDKHYKPQLTKASTGTFIQNYYVTNSNVKEKYLNIIKTNQVETYIQPENNYIIDVANNLLITYFDIPDINHKPMGHFILFMPLDKVYVDDIYNARNQLLTIFVFLIVLLIVVLRYLSNQHLTKKIKEINVHLEEKVSLKNRELIEQGAFLQSILDGVSNAVTVIDKQYNVTLMNKVAQNNSGYTLLDDEKIKCYDTARHHEKNCRSKANKCPHNDVFSTGKQSKVVHNYLSDEGKTLFIEITASPLFNEAGEVEAIIELGHDITDHILVHEQLKEQKELLSYQAENDALTGLPNRVLFVDRVDQAIKLAKREQTKIAILFIDLDRFKEINDTLGHNVGDKVLIEVAQRLKDAIRNVDTVARLGGDEFTLILANIHHLSSVMKIAQDLVEVLAQKIMYGENELYVTASIGISLYPDDGKETDILLRNSDSAMYHAKEQGRNNYQFYTQQMTDQAIARIALEKNLRSAIKNNEFEVYYQPQFNAQSKEIVGMEALLRWHHPTKGLISPAEFIPIAEETGMIIEIGWQVIDRVIKQHLQWRAAGYSYAHISINLSVKQIQDADFIQKIVATLESYQYQPQDIRFEVTESYIMTDPELAIKTLKELKALKFSISIDDFGTGYSSLSYLKRLPLDELKIDQSFVRDLPGDEEDEAIVRLIISLAKSLSLEVIAEGVETAEQQAFLLAEHCEKMQGYVFHRPLEVEKMTAILRQRMLW
ncbi:EAL domain-containing protein [sulfur-oxidizing endosymbiont of Gigantopelta aegis]|uniref:EAL domain-containing protein n=1 Tax=sulfur-oxidizing endosymbiont of Gigantopelta aegis TaxID=2794934 RepID=UPI0018DBA4BB|nr:EAL domain-containing protein [sulfur-oxidizing endosymbiont of Gigantopelta aegis]